MVAMPMQRFAVAFCVAAYLVHDVLASRLRFSSSGGSNVSMNSDSSASCMYECGQEDVAVDWDVEEPDGSVRTVSESFTIGAGKRTKYKVKANECLSRCQVLTITDKQGKKPACASLHPGSTTVSRSDQYKLCCKPKLCSYIPEESRYRMHEKGEAAAGGIRPYAPLAPLTGNTVPPRTCLCCSTEASEMVWDQRVKARCKKAYEAGAGNLIHGPMRLLTLQASDAILRARCRSYCGHYEDYPHGLRSKERRSLIAFTAKARTPVAVKPDPDETTEEEDRFSEEANPFFPE